MMKRQNMTMAKMMKVIAIICVAATAFSAIFYKITLYDIFLTLAITFGTVTYHFAMRLLVGLVFNVTMHNKANYQKRWYQLRKHEKHFYEKIKVKQWKNKMPTYNSDFFNPKLHTWDEIAQSMCQAELVHETIVVLSFVPIAAGIWFGTYPVFILTSILAALFDMVFVIMQRYNRARIIRFKSKYTNNPRP